MSFKKALLSSVVLVGVAQGAMAASLTNISLGSAANGSVIGAGATYPIAAEYSFGTASPTSSLTFRVVPTDAFLPAGNVLLSIALDNAVFASDLQSANVVATTTNDSGAPGVSISAGGAALSSTAEFLLSSVNQIGPAGAPGTVEGFIVTVPIRATGAAVGVRGGFKTELQTPVDGGMTATRQIVRGVSAYDPVVAADTVTSELSLASGFRSFTGDGILGRVAVGRSATDGIRKDLTGGATAAADLTQMVVAVTGDFTGFGTGTADARLVLDDGAGATATFAISGTSANVTVGAGALLTAAYQTAATLGPAIRIVPNSPQGPSLNASAYSATVTARYAAPLNAGAESSSATSLQSTTRAGTSLLFPWTASGNTANLSGSTNLIRLGNRTSTAITGVFGRVLNSSTSLPSSSTLVALGSIPANGELVLTSSGLQTALGDFGRGDIEIVIEAPASSVTARRLVQRPDGVFEWRQGAGTASDAAP